MSKRAGWLRVRTTRVLGGVELETVTSVYCPFEGRSKGSEYTQAQDPRDGRGIDVIPGRTP